MQISDFFNALESAAGLNLQVDKTRCVNVRNRHASCRKCMESCPSGCLSLTEQGAEVKAEACTACGICTTVCPTGALALPSLTFDHLRQVAQDLLKNEEQAIVISCNQTEKLPELNGLLVFQVPCLGMVDESLLAFIAGEGVSKIYVNVAICCNCNLTNSQDVIWQTCNNANALFEAWGSNTRVIMKLTDRRDDSADELSITKDPITLPEQTEFSKSPKKRVLPKVGKDGTLIHAVPEKRSALLNELRSWIEPAGEMLESDLFGRAEIDRQRCRSCRMCTVFCPTGALRRVTGEQFGIEHRADICLGCRTCEEVCPTGALSISNLVPVSRIIQGDSEFYPLEPMENTPSNPHQTLKAIKKMLGEKQIYER